ncbi:hypothetical protein GIB67_028035 [Kingdonia uniflora]|uniref:Uncharacterized protein n=1 Tax=Kingdonia uniflora TaxID=39325 RepID=A0A7J7NE71_9MAGN|nr:hypothetical protein GIB67_028035 [Kingdonia uniflora]
MESTSDKSTIVHDDDLVLPITQVSSPIVSSTDCTTNESPNVSLTNDIPHPSPTNNIQYPYEISSSLDIPSGTITIDLPLAPTQPTIGDVPPCVGSMLRAITGALKGQESKNALFRGFAVGLISGAFLSIHVFEHSLLLWQSGNTEIMCLQYIVDVITSLLSGRSIPGQIGHIPTMLSPVQNHLHTRSSFDEVPNVFDIEGSKGLSEDLV